MTFFEIAEPLAARGFRVFPLIPGLKRPVKLASGDHFDYATTDLVQLQEWSDQEPTANVGISPDEYHMFLETDCENELKAACADLPPEIWETARVTSGRKDRCYYIFRHTQRTRTTPIKDKMMTRKGQDNLFEFKSYRTLVTGPGSIHPDTKQPYTVEWKTIIPMPAVLLDRLCELIGAPKEQSAEMGDETKRETARLDDFLEYYEVATNGEWFKKSKSWYRPVVCPWADEHENDSGPTSTCIVYTEGSGYGFDCKHRCADKGWPDFRDYLRSKFPDKPKFRFSDTPEVVVNEIDEAWDKLGKPPEAPEPEPVSDWRSLFHTKDEAITAPDTSFLIAGFLQCEGVTAIAAPVRERKTFVALNIARSLLTGEKLFGHFDVVKLPTRILYLCPEVSLGPFTDRIKKLGLIDYVGETFFYRTLSSDGRVKLKEPALIPALPGSVVILDTAIRFLEGKENDSGDVRVFADDIFALLKHGAASVVLLHHSPKDSGDYMTLENAMRGSGDMGAFLACCWGTKLQDPTDPYKSASYLENLKQRDFESKPFEVSCDANGKLTMIGDPAINTASLKPRGGFKANKDGKDEVADALIKANPDLSIRKLQELIKESGFSRGVEWIHKAKARIKGTGVTLS